MSDMFKLPKVSFVVISHNFEKFILECLESVKKQKYENIEIIVVDDNSLDATCSIIEEFIRSSSGLNIYFIKNKKNIGQLACFLQGVEKASGEFISQIDGDDVLLDNYALVHVEAHLKSSVALTSCQNFDIDERGTVHSFASIDCPQKKTESYNLDASTAVEVKNILKIDEAEPDVKLLSNDKYSFATWHWAPATSGMIRKSVCELLLQVKNPQHIKITSDKFVFSFAHLIGSSAVIYKPLYAYRKHTANYSLANPVFGSVRYLKTKTQQNYIKNNKLIRQSMLVFIMSNYSFFVDKFNRANVWRIIQKIIFSFDISTLKSLMKTLFI